MSETWSEDAESNLWWEFSQNWKGNRNSGYGLQVCSWNSPEDDGYGRPCHSHLLSASLFREKKGSETDISAIWYFPLKMKNIWDCGDLIPYMNCHLAFLFSFSLSTPLSCWKSLVILSEVNLWKNDRSAHICMQTRVVRISWSGNEQNISSGINTNIWLKCQH